MPAPLAMGEAKLALSKNTLIKIIRENGHLALEGNEKIGELRIAVIHLRTHFLSECRHSDLGTPIELLVPDITVLAPAKRVRPARRVQDVDLPAIPRGPSLGD